MWAHAHAPVQVGGLQQRLVAIEGRERQQAQTAATATAQLHEACTYYIYTCMCTYALTTCMHVCMHTLPTLHGHGAAARGAWATPPHTMGYTPLHPLTPPYTPSQERPPSREVAAAAGLYEDELEALAASL